MDKFDKCIAALHAVKLIREAHASGPEAQELTAEIIEVLRAGAADRSIEVHVAVALDKWRNNQAA